MGGCGKCAAAPGGNGRSVPTPWHFNFAWAGETYRFSLERTIGRIVQEHRDVGVARSRWVRDLATLGDTITGKTDAENEADRLRTAIRTGTLQRPTDLQGSALDRLTLARVLATYDTHVLSATVARSRMPGRKFVDHADRGGVAGWHPAPVWRVARPRHRWAGHRALPAGPSHRRPDRAADAGA